MSRIPDASRALVRNRSHGRCERCGVPTANGEWHHRRGRAVKDEHTHHPCNGVWLCGMCHREVHALPILSRDMGFIVSRHIDLPALVAVTTPWGIRHHDCGGGYTFTL